MKSLLERISWRFLVPSAVLIGAVPQYFTMWFLWRIVGFVLPVWVYQIGDDLVWSTYQRLILFFFEHWTGAEVIFYGEYEEVFKRRERVLYISNHQSTVDWIAVDMIAIRQGSLGNLRYVMKDGLQFIPSFGFYFYNHGCIYVRRGNFSPDKMMKGLDFLKNPKIPSWLIIFPEGTRYNPEAPEVIQKSVKYAKEEGLSTLEQHLCPKSKGLFMSLEKLRNQFDAVYNVTIVYEDSVDQESGRRHRAPQMIDFLKLRKPRVHIHIERIAIADVPKQESELKSWLHNVFVHKDKLVSKFYAKEHVDEVGLTQFSNGLRHRLNLRSTLPALLLFSCVQVPMWAFPFGRTVTWNLWLFGTLFGYTWLTIASVA